MPVPFIPIPNYKMQTIQNIRKYSHFLSTIFILLLCRYSCVMGRLADDGNGMKNNDGYGDLLDLRTPFPAIARDMHGTDNTITAAPVIEDRVYEFQRNDHLFLADESNNIPKSTSFDPFSTTITNDIPWNDDRGYILETGRGGKISRFDGWFWWVGSQPNKVWNNGGDIFLYKSLGGGSNSWQFVRKVWEFEEDAQTSANCQIHKHPKSSATGTNTIHIHCKGLKFFVSHDGVMGEFKWIQPKPLDPSGLAWQGWNWGSCTVFRDGDSMYMAASRIDRSQPLPGKTRKGFIYKLRDDWLAFDETDPIVVEFPWEHREAYHILKYDGWYYLGASTTRGWRQSKSWYKRSRTLKGLKDAQEHEMMMHPSSDRDFLSMGTQFRFLFEMMPGKWVFGGSRHPDEDPNDFDPKFGRYVIAPVQFIDGVPNVYWKRQFEWDAYDYSSGDYDPHNDAILFPLGNTVRPYTTVAQKGVLEESRR